MPQPIPAEAIALLGDSFEIAKAELTKGILPDSIHIYQSKEPVFAWGLPRKDFLQIIIPSISIIISIIIAGFGFWLVGYREKSKDNIRKKNLRTHVVTWLKIIKIQYIHQAFNLYNAKSLVHVVYTNVPDPIIIDLKFHFDQVLSLDKVDLTEVFILHSTDEEKNISKLNDFTSIGSDITNFKQMETDAIHRNIIILKEQITEQEMTYNNLHMLISVALEFKQATDLLKNVKAAFVYPLLDFNYFEAKLNVFKEEMKQHQLLSIYQESYDRFIEMSEKLIATSTNLHANFKSLEIFILLNSKKLDLMEKFYRNEIEQPEFDSLYTPSINDNEMKQLYRYIGVLNPDNIINS